MREHRAKCYMLASISQTPVDGHWEQILNGIQPMWSANCYDLIAHLSPPSFLSIRDTQPVPLCRIVPEPWFLIALFYVQAAAK